MSVVVSTNPSSVYIGRNTTVICIVSSGGFIDVDITPTISWQVSNPQDDVPPQTIIPDTISSITPTIFSTSLEFNPILGDMVFTCSASVEPIQPMLNVAGSQQTSTTFFLNVEGTYLYLGAF